jgi:hypothetical protein
VGSTRNLISYRKLVAEAIKLEEMSARSTFARILQSEEDKETIKESFQRIDEFTKDFHVRELHIYHGIDLLTCYFQLSIVMSIERSTNDIEESLFVGVLNLPFKQNMCLPLMPETTPQ